MYHKKHLFFFFSNLGYFTRGQENSDAVHTDRFKNALGVSRKNARISIL